MDLTPLGEGKGGKKGKGKGKGDKSAKLKECFLLREERVQELLSCLRKKSVHPVGTPVWKWILRQARENLQKGKGRAR